MSEMEEIDQVIEGRDHISISTIKLKTGIDGRAIARYLRNTGEWERYTQGKTSRPVWTRKVIEQYCSNCGMMDDSCGCDHPNLKEIEQ
ncbi:unnamed protein product [marine sediment metagenome]|uniref:Uncharacterized protein n=1 Tax=marine sediment metagenome TaxID=412755 RepID=X1SII6_9ZZZZ